MITTGGLCNGFPHPFGKKLKKEEEEEAKHRVSSSLHQQAAAFRLSWGRWWWRWWWGWRDIHVPLGRAWRNPSAERHRQRLEREVVVVVGRVRVGEWDGESWRFLEIQRGQVRVWASEAAVSAASPDRAPPAALPHSIWRRASTSSGRAHGMDRLLLTTLRPDLYRLA